MKHDVKGFSKEKSEWIEEVGIREFEHPMKFYTQYGGLYSEEYIKNTSLEELKKRYESTLPIAKEIHDMIEIRTSVQVDSQLPAASE